MEILDYLPQIDILYFHNRLPENDLLQPLLVRRLYKRVLAHSKCHFPWVYVVDQVEMCSIVDHEADMRSMVKENAPVQRLEINLWCTYFSMTWFFNVVAEHPDYFSRIPSLVYNGPARLISTFASVCLVNNLVTLCIPEPEPSVRLPRFSSKLSRMIIGVYHSYKINTYRI